MSSSDQGLESPQQDYLPDAFTFVYLRTGVRLEMDRFEEARGGLTAEVVIHTTREPRPGFLRRQRLNLLAGGSIKKLAEELEERESEVDWNGLLTQVCELAIRRWREGEPLVDLEQGPARPGSKYLLPPYLELGNVNTIFAFGGSAKSYLALAMGLSVAGNWPLLGCKPTETGNVLYLDWEADQYEHTERLHALKAGAGICEPLRHTIFYRRQVASLGESAHPLKRMIKEHAIKLVIIDSMGPARGGELKDDYKTNVVFDAARTLNVTVAIIDHLPKGAESDRTRPIGSIQSENRSRNMWRVDKVQEEGEDSIRVAFVHTKSNNGRKEPRRGFHMVFERGDDGVLLSLTIRPTDLMAVPDFRKGAPHYLQIQAILMDHAQSRDGLGPCMSTTEIHEELKADGIKMSETGVRTVLNEYKRLFVPLPTPRGQPRLWALRAREEVDEA